MAAVTNKRKVLSVAEKDKLIREIENGKKEAFVFREFGFVNSRIKKICKNRTTLVSVFEQNESRKKLFRNPEGVKSMRRCLSGLSSRELTVYQSGILFS